MRFSTAAVAALFVFALAAQAAAQSGGVHVSHEKVSAALASSAVLITAPQVQVSGGHRDKAGALPTQKATVILYVTSGEGVLSVAKENHHLTKGDVMVIPANTAHSLSSVSPSISYYMVAVPVLAAGAKAEVVYVGHDKVAAATRKAAPLADGPNLRVSGGYRTGPYAPEDYRPAVEIHTNEADLFYVIDGTATQILGGAVVGGKETGPGQVRGSKIDGGSTYQISPGDVVWVPAGTPHWFPEIPTPLSYLLVKVFY